MNQTKLIKKWNQEYSQDIVKVERVILKQGTFPHCQQKSGLG